MTTFVTGGCGFVGSFVTKRIAASGERVVVFDANPDSRHLHSLLTDAERELVTVERGDLLDLTLIMQLTLRHEVDKFVHLAYLGRKSTLANAAWSQYVDIVGTNNVFEMAATVGAPLVWTSTADVFGPKSVGPDGIVANDAPYDPANIYGACKVHNEVTAREYAELKGLESLAIRLPAVFGPTLFPIHSWVNFLARMVQSVIRTGEGEYPAGEDMIPWSYVEDVAEVVVNALHPAERSTRAVTIGGPVMSMSELVGAVQRRFPDARLVPVEYPPVGLMPSYDTSVAVAELGWEPKVGVDDGIARMARYYEGLEVAG